MSDLEKVGVMYIGGLSRVEARFPEEGVSILFERSIPKYLDPEIAAMFRPSRDWVIGVSGSDIHGETVSHVMVRRAVALGDVICVHGALQGVLNAFPGRYEISYQVSPVYVDVFKFHPAYKHVISSTDSLMSIRDKIDHFVSLDALLEKDHNVGEDKISRVDRAWRHFFSSRPELMNDANLKPDFTLTIPERTREWAYRELKKRNVHDGKRLVAVASRAVQRPRNLQDGLVERFTRELVDKLDVHVILIEFDTKYIWSGDQIHGFPGSSALEAMALMQYCDVLCTMDSGAMWMGHCIPIPMVVWFGPTPPETKVNYHPYWPSGIRALRMWEWVDCPNACYENASWCNWEYRCVKQPPVEMFIQKSIQAVKELLDMEKHGGQEEDQ